MFLSYGIKKRLRRDTFNGEYGGGVARIEKKREKRALREICLFCLFREINVKIAG